MNKDIIIAIVLGILIVLSAVQAIQLNSLKEDIKSSDIATLSAGSPVQSQAAVPTLQNTPTMVGGC